jgi:hypothetical protein
VGNEFPPPGLPVTGMTSLQFPLVNSSSDPTFVQSQLMAAMALLLLLCTSHNSPEKIRTYGKL